MKKIIIYTLLSLFTISCSSNRAKQIPDKEFKEMLIDIVFMGSYMGDLSNELDIDTLSFYEPIFKRYGYTTADLEHTMRLHLKRKSNVLPTIIDDATNMLDKRVQVVKWRNDLNIDWNNRSKEYYRTTLLEKNDSLLLKKVEDLDTIKYSIPVQGFGDYNVRYRYKTNIDDKNGIRYFRYSFIDTLRKKQELTSSTSWLTRSNDEFKNYTKTITLDSENKYTNQIDIELVYYGNNNEKAVKQHITFDSLKVEYTPETKDAALRYMIHKTGLDTVKTLINNYNEENSGSLPYKWWKNSKEPIDSIGQLGQDSLSRE